MNGVVVKGLTVLRGYHTEVFFQITGSFMRIYFSLHSHWYWKQHPWKLTAVGATCGHCHAIPECSFMILIMFLITHLSRRHFERLRKPLAQRTRTYTRPLMDFWVVIFRPKRATFLMSQNRRQASCFVHIQGSSPQIFRDWILLEDELDMRLRFLVVVSW